MKSLIIIFFFSPIYVVSQVFDSLENKLNEDPISQKTFQAIAEITYKEFVNDLKSSQQLFDLALVKKTTRDSIKGNLAFKASIVQYLSGNYELSTRYGVDALSIFDSLGLELKYANVLGSLAYNGKRRNIKQSLKQVREAHSIISRLGDSASLSTIKDHYGVILELNGDLDSALFYYHDALNFKRAQNDSVGIPYSLNNIGGVHFINGAPELGLPFFEESGKIRALTGDSMGLCWNAIYLAKEYMNLNEPDKSEGYLKEAFIIQSGLNYPDMEVNVLKEYARYYEFIGKNDSALVYFKNFHNKSEALFNEKKSNKVMELEAAFDSERKDALISETRARNAENQLEIAEKNAQRNFFVAIVISMCALALFLFRNIRQKKKINQEISAQRDKIKQQKELVDDAHKEITDSIAYAKRIQTAILPPAKLVNEYLRDSFILYKPKDVVAGDFYWLEKKEGKILFAAADCTGHGVPGAMVSVICNNGLNRSVREYGLTDPGLILDKTRELVIQEFEKSEEEVKDGMDVALCSIEGMTLQYAGANNSLWIIRGDEIIEIKANKQPIGKYLEPKPFTTHTITLEKQDSIYVFSDGFVDQFGGEKGKKFKPSNLRKLLLSIQTKSMCRQKELMDQAFESWRGNLEQIDDVCLIGVKI